MNQKTKDFDDAEILTSANPRNSSVYKILVPHSDEIIDCDEIQAQHRTVSTPVESIIDADGIQQSATYNKWGSFYDF